MVTNQEDPLISGIDRVSAPHLSSPPLPPDSSETDTEAAVMDRDYRLTGKFREQTDSVKAPVGFDVNNPWRVCQSLRLGDLLLTTI